MATISLANSVGSNKAPVQTTNLKVPYMIWREVDLAAAATAKGSALAAADVIEALRVPKDHVILRAFAKKSNAMTGTSTDAAFSLGVTGVSAAAFATAWGYAAAAVGSYATPTAPQVVLPLTASDTIDLLITTQTGTVTGGKIIVYAEVVDMSVQQRAAIAQPKS